MGDHRLKSLTGGNGNAPIPIDPRMLLQAKNVGPQPMLVPQKSFEEALSGDIERLNRRAKDLGAAMCDLKGDDLARVKKAAETTLTEVYRLKAGYARFLAKFADELAVSSQTTAAQAMAAIDRLIGVEAKPEPAPSPPAIVIP